MFDNTIILKSKTGVTDATVSITDLSQPGRVVREDSSFKLTNNFGKTKEGGLYEFSRISSRIERTLTGLANAAQPNSKAYAQLIIGYPKDDVATVAIVSALICDLMHFVAAGGNSGTVPFAYDATGVQTNLLRLMSHEG